jgi:hypothetical protein
VFYIMLLLKMLLRDFIGFSRIWVVKVLVYL